MSEVEGWAAFGGWVRGEIDRLAAGDSAASEDDKDGAAVPTARILEYIQGSLTSSPLAQFFTPLDSAARELHTAALESTTTTTNTPLFEAMAKALNSPEPSNAFHKALPNIAALTNHLATQAKAVSSGIADAEKRNVRFSDAVEVGVSKEVLGEEGRCNMKMCSGTTSGEGGGEGGVSVYIATSAVGAGEVGIQRISLPQDSEGKASVTKAKVEVAGSVRDLAFLDEEILLILVKGEVNEEGTYILALPFQSLAYTAKPTPVLGEGRRFRVQGGEAERIRVGGGRVVVVMRGGWELRF